AERTGVQTHRFALDLIRVTWRRSGQVMLHAAVLADPDDGPVVGVGHSTMTQRRNGQRRDPTRLVAPAVGIPAPTRRIDVAEVQAGRTTRSLLVSGVGTELEHRSPHRGSWATGSGSHTPFLQWSPWESYAPGALRAYSLAAVGTATTVSPSKR